MCKASLNHRRKGSLAFLWCSMLWKSFALAVRRNGRAALKSNDYVIMPLWWENNIGSKFSTPIYRLKKKNNTYGICSLYNHEHPEVQHVFHWLQGISFDTPTVLTDLHVTSKGFFLAGLIAGIRTLLLVPWWLSVALIDLWFWVAPFGVENMVMYSFHQTLRINWEDCYIMGYRNLHLLVI